MFRWIFLITTLVASFETWAAAQSLSEIYQEAMQNDPVLASANSANLAAQEIIEQAKATYRPSVSFSASAATNHTNIQLTGATPFRNGANNFQTYTATVNASQPIYRRENLKRIDQSEIHVSLSDKQYHLARQNLILRTTQAYFEVLLAQDQIGLIQAQKAAIQSQLAQAKASFEAGTVNVTDVNEAKARFDLIAAQLLSAENNLEIAKRSLQVITGKLPLSLASLKSTLNISSDLPPMQNWQETTLHNNLNIQIQQDQLQITEHDIEIARSGHYPTVDAVASYSDSDNTGSQYGYGYRLQNAAIGVQMSIPLYQGGGVDSKVRQAAYNRQKALDDLQTATRQATLDTQRAYLDLNNSMAQIHALKQALASSQSQLDSTTLGHEVGVRTSVDVLNAQQQYFSAHRDLLQARYNYLVNIIRLKTASGVVNETDIMDIDQQLVKQ